MITSITQRLTLSIALVMTLCACAYSQQIVLTVSGLDADQGGRVSAGLYSSSDGWTKPGKQVAGTSTAINGSGQVDVVFEEVPPGTYALAIMHDANSNDKMDTNFIGIPKEGYTFSNNAFGRLGPPSFDDASFKVVDGQTASVSATMKY
jgi:uncharacterized protein (DUF2141 family)